MSQEAKIEVKKDTKKRIFELDFLRGFCVLLMVIDHFMYDFAYFISNIFNFNPGGLNNPDWLNSLNKFSINWWNWDVRIIARFAVIFLFFLISGICTRFSKNNLKRGLIIFGVGALLSLGFFAFSKIFDANFYVFFGTISCFGFCILFYYLIDLVCLNLFKLKEKFFAVLCLILGIIFTVIGCTVFKFYNLQLVNSVTWDNLIYLIIGKYSFGVDYMGLFPYMGLFFIGAGLSTFIYANKKSVFSCLDGKMHTKPSIKDHNHFVYFLLLTLYYIYSPIYYLCIGISKAGKHSLWIYLFHQVVFCLIISIIMLSLGYKFAI